MKESDLRDYLEGETSALELSKMLKSAIQVEPVNGAPILVEQVKLDAPPLEITPKHLLVIIKDVLKRELKEEYLSPLAFILLYSEHYTWNGESADGERVSTVIFDWDAADVNFGLSRSNIKKWQTYLHTGEYKFTNEEK